MNINDIVKQLEKYVTLDRFNPVEKIVYGFTGIVLTTVMLAILALIIKK
jgi:hypothetical protein